jgi:hypothetical protein
VREMTKEDPAARPKVEEVKNRFDHLIRDATPGKVLQPREPLVLREGKKENRHERLSGFDVWVRRMRRAWCSFLGKPAIPTPARGRN